jgi:hypothetical protein
VGDTVEDATGAAGTVVGGTGPAAGLTDSGTAAGGVLGDAVDTLTGG